jgi:hypothetical protein
MHAMGCRRTSGHIMAGSEPGSTANVECRWELGVGSQKSEVRSQISDFGFRISDFGWIGGADAERTASQDAKLVSQWSSREIALKKFLPRFGTIWLDLPVASPATIMVNGRFAARSRRRRHCTQVCMRDMMELGQGIGSAGPIHAFIRHVKEKDGRKFALCRGLIRTKSSPRWDFVLRQTSRKNQ